jgi:hypothetical protein
VELDSNARTGEEKPPLSKRVLYRTLSILWIFPSLGAVFILARRPGFRSKETASWIDLIRRFPLENWLAVILLVLHLLFIYNAIRYARRERN